MKKKTLRMKISVIRKSINFEKSICIYMVFYFLRKKGGISLANFMNKDRILGFVYCGFWMYILHINFMVSPSFFLKNIEGKYLHKHKDWHLHKLIARKSKQIKNAS